MAKVLLQKVQSCYPAANFFFKRNSESQNLKGGNLKTATESAVWEQVLPNVISNSVKSKKY